MWARCGRDVEEMWGDAGEMWGDVGEIRGDDAVPHQRGEGAAARVVRVSAAGCELGQHQLCEVSEVVVEQRPGQG